MNKILRRTGKIIIISGPSGSGKTTLYKKLLADPFFKKRLFRSISVTTRPRRAGEKHGRDYLFVSHKMFLYKRRAGHFLEWQKVFGNYYGTPKKNVRNLFKRGKNVLLCIDVKGAAVVRRKYPSAIRIFIKTPSLEVLRRRLENRRSEGSEVINQRLKIAKQELKEASHYNHIIINDNLSKAYKDLISRLHSQLN